MNPLLLSVIVSLASLDAPQPLPDVPGLPYAPPDYAQAAGAPLIYSYSTDAGADESFVLVGEGFTAELMAWGIHPEAATGREIKLKVQIGTPGLLLATVPETAFEGPIVVWAKNKAGYSEPVVINAPELWWCERESVETGSVVSLFGRNLSQRPDFSRSFVYLAQAGKPGTWLKVIEGGKYRVRVLLPRQIEPGRYQLWIHAGNGGKYGWGGPLPLAVRSPSPSSPVRVAPFDGGNLQEAVNRLAADGGGTLELPAGSFNLASTPLVIPAKVQVTGAGIDRTVLVSPSDPAAPRTRVYEAFPVVWLAGDGASIASLTVRANPRTSIGVLVHNRQELLRIRDCRVTGVKVCGGGWRGIQLSNAVGADVRNNEFWGWTPVTLSGVEGCRLVGNRLVAQTLNGGNSEAYVTSSGCRVRRCIIEDNVCACPPGAEAGGPTGQRFIHFCTGRGSVDQNWIAGNRVDKARFGDVSWAADGSGDMQNTGEVILFEAVERIAYYGPLAAAGRQSATLPAVLPRTPDKRLGNASPRAACPRRGRQRNALLAAGRGPGLPGAERGAAAGRVLRHGPLRPRHGPNTAGRGPKRRNLSYGPSLAGRPASRQPRPRPHRILAQPSDPQPLRRWHDWRPALGHVHREHTQRQPGRADAERGDLSVCLLHDAGLFGAELRKRGGDRPAVFQPRRGQLV